MRATEFKARFTQPGFLIGLAAAFGVISRFVQYIFAKSIWVDEAAIAINVIHKSYAQLLGRLEYDQCAPAGFLFITKFCVEVFGNNPWALRLFPFVMSIMAIFLFMRLAKACLCDWAAVIAMLLFSCSTWLAYYSAEVKQYGVDVAVCIALLLAAIRIHQSSKLSVRAVLGFILLFVVSVWFSHPAMFFAAGTGLSLFIFAIMDRQFAKVYQVVTIFGLCVISIAANYMLVLRHMQLHDWLVEFWDERLGFMPLIPTSRSDLAWYPRAVKQWFQQPMGFHDAIVGLLLFASGLAVLFRNRRRQLLLVIMPICVALAVSAAGKYPFSRRIVLYTLPVGFIVVACGMHFIIKRIRPAGRLVCCALMFVLLFYPVVLGSIRSVRPIVKEESQQVMAYLAGQYQPGDMVYVYSRCHKTFRYYAEKLGLYDKCEFVIGDKFEDATDLPRQVGSIKNRSRVWVFLTHNLHNDSFSAQYLLSKYLDRIGTRLDYRCGRGVWLYLYDLR